MFVGWNGLVVYIVDLEFFFVSRVVYYNEKFVVINDMFFKVFVYLFIFL